MVTYGVGLAEMIKGIGVAMVTTAGSDGRERNRPLATLPVSALPPESGEELWFVTRRGSETAAEVREKPQVRLCYTSPRDQRFVTVFGKAAVVFQPDNNGQGGERASTDLARGSVEMLHQDPLLQQLAELDLALLRVRIEQAEFWDAPTGRMVRIAGVGSN